MFKNKKFLVVLTGLVLAFILLAVITFLSKPLSGGQTGAVTETPNTNSPLSVPVSGQFDHSPAGIFSATQSGSLLLLAGSGVSGAGISLLVDNNEIARTKVDASGQWQIDFGYDFQTGPRVLEILMLTPDGHEIRSDQSLFVIPVPRKLPRQAQDGTGPEDPGRVLLLLTAPGANSRVLQTPYQGILQSNGFSLEVIDYDNSGGVIFSGSANRHGKVRIYAGGNLVGETHVDGSGRWSLIFGNIMPLGEYEISAELVVEKGEGGEEDSTRITLPFARMRPMFEAEGSPKLLVQHLDNRIQIGRALFGGGYQYSVIYAPEALN